MGITIVKDSHVDHGLSPQQLDWLLSHFADRTTFFVETLELPPELGTVKCGLHGPAAKTEPVTESEVFHEKRGDRTWQSRMCNRDQHDTRLVTFIAGTDEGHKDEGMILFTVYGGPSAPQEPGDPQCKDVAASKEFWSQHALSK